jgi:hypothetical protein
VECSVILLENVLPKSLQSQCRFLAAIFPQKSNALAVHRKSTISVLSNLASAGKNTAEILRKQLPVRMSVTHDGIHYCFSIKSNVAAFLNATIEINAGGGQFAR